MIINIGRELCAGGRAIGKRVASTLGLAYFDKELLLEASRASGISPALFERADEEHDVFMYALGSRNAELFHFQSETIQRLAERGDCLFIGRCADYILRDRNDCLNVFLSANKEDRMARLAVSQHLAAKACAEMIEKADKRRAEYYNFYTDKVWGAAQSYDLCINTSRFPMEEVVQQICQAAQRIQQAQKA